MPARDDILAALRAAAPAAAALPDLKGLRAVRYPDLKRRFMESVVEVGARCVEVAGPLEAALATVPEYAAARKVVSLVPGVAKATVSYKDKTAVVIYDDSKTTVPALVKVTTEAGYPSAPKN